MDPPADLHLRFKRHPDGSASLTCTRRDGSVTWQRQRGSSALVFPPHDLTHYAVETVLGFRSGFYGLLADGWEIGDFAAPWPRGPLPDEALVVELIVGSFDVERRSGEALTAAAFEAQIAQHVASRRATGKHTPAQLPHLTDEELDRVRTCRTALLAQWLAVPPAAALDLTFIR